ncbi:MoaD/ThiS family protein [Thermodesulfobacteriota bacterium]
MEITVKYSSLLKILIRQEKDIMDVDEGTTIDQLTRILDQKYKNLRFNKEKTKFLIDNVFVDGDKVLAEGDEVSVFQTLKNR